MALHPTITQKASHMDHNTLFEYTADTPFGRKLSAIQDQLFEQNKILGWWDGVIGDQEKLDATIPVKLALVHSEITEAFDGMSSKLMDDHLPQYPMFDVEIADAVIRILDLAGAMGLQVADLEGESAVHTEAVVARDKANNLLMLHKYASNMIECHRKGKHIDLSFNLSVFVNYSFKMAEVYNFDMFKIIADKVTYNGQRADHKRENRQATGGKSY